MDTSGDDVQRGPGDTEHLLEEVASTLSKIRHGSGLKRTTAMGEIILNSLFSGDPGAWHDRRRNKAESLRRLARVKGCTLSKSTLSQAVSVYVAMIGLPVLAFRHVQASHVAVVLSLPFETRRQLLEQAEKERWSVRTLRRRVRSPAGGDVAPESAPASNGLRSTVERLAQVVRDMHHPAQSAPSGAVIDEIARQLSDVTTRLSRESIAPGRAGGRLARYSGRNSSAKNSRV